MSDPSIIAKLLEFAVFDEFGHGADDRVQMYATDQMLAERARNADEITRLRAALAAQVPQWRAVVDAAREAMNESFEAGNEAMDIAIPAHLAAALSLRLDEFDSATGAPPPPAALAVPAGMALVPVEPTELMQLAGALAHQQSVCHDFIGPISDAWAAMLAASRQAAVCIQCGARHGPGQNTMCAA